MAADPLRGLPYIAQVVDLAPRAGGRPVLVRSVAGGGAGLVVRAAGDVLAAHGVAVEVVESVAALDPDAQLAVRGRRRTHAVLLASEDGDLDAAADRLIAFLRPTIVDVQPLGVDAVREVVDGVLGAERCSDDLAAAIQLATAGRMADVVEVARHLAAPGHAPREANADLDLAGFRPTQTRLTSPEHRPRAIAGAEPDPDTVAWAIATAEGVSALAALHAPAGPLRPIDAAVVRAELHPDSRIDALRGLCEDAASIESGTLVADEQVTVATWWCELADASSGRAMLSGPELQALFAGIVQAVDTNRWSAAARIAERLWRTTRVAQAASGVAAALCRTLPTPLLDEVLDAHPDDAQLHALGAFCRALWQLYVEHRPDVARATLEAALVSLAAPDENRAMCEDGLAMVDVHTGDPDAVERRVGDRPPVPGRPTSFALGTLALADLARAHHGLVLERLDAEIERNLHPGMNLTADRYRFVRSLVFARSGLGDPLERDELDEELRRLYDGALRRGDDWNLGWTAWTAGQFDARAGRTRRGGRRLRTAIAAYHRAHRPGFADWPLATLVATLALHAGELPTAEQIAALSHPTHAVAAERSDALLALALHARASGRAQHEVAALLREAMAVASRQREVLTGQLVAVEQLLLGITPDAPPDSARADGPVLVACRQALAGSVDAWEAAGVALIDLDWSVLGVRLIAHAADAVRRDDPRRATRLLQTVRETTDRFDEPLRPWALVPAELPTLSARELEIARGIASGASRDELAATLVLSRRTIDSHLQRVYAKLGISSRAELREWLDR